MIIKWLKNIIKELKVEQKLKLFINKIVRNKKLIEAMKVVEVKNLMKIIIIMLIMIKVIIIKMEVQI